MIDRRHTVAILWESKTMKCLRISTYWEDTDGVYNEDEALGKAMRDQKKDLENPLDFAPTVWCSNITTRDTTPDKPSFSWRHC